MPTPTSKMLNGSYGSHNSNKISNEYTNR